MATDAEHLLATEQAIHELLRELEELKAQVGGYEHARKSLDEVRQTLEQLVERTSSLAEQTHSLTGTLGRIGTPEIMVRIDNARSEVSQAVGGLASRIEELHRVHEAEAAKRSQQLRRLLIGAVTLAGLSLAGTIGCVVLILAHK